MYDVDVAGLEPPPEVVEAAFALATYTQSQQEEDEEEQPQEGPDTHFEWDEDEVATPKELLELWGRAQRGERPIPLRSLLETNKKLSGIPASAPENNLIQVRRRRTDKFLKDTSEAVLLGNNWLPQEPGSTRQPTNLQVWQYLGELYWRIQHERKELAVPGVTKGQGSGQDNLFTEEDVRSQRVETSIQRIRGGYKSRPFGPSFRFFSLSTEHSSNNFNSFKHWKGKGSPYGMYGIQGKGFRKGFGKGGFKPGSWLRRQRKRYSQPSKTLPALTKCTPRSSN